MKMEKKGKNKKKILFTIIIIILLLILSMIGVFFWLKSPINKNAEEITFNVKAGENYRTIADDLEDSELIRNKYIYLLYIKLLKPNSLEAGTYKLSSSMDIEKIINTLSDGATNDEETIKITFVEGKNMRYIINKIIESFNISEEEILSQLTDKEYLDSLIKNHWIISEEIKNDKLYYSLEGYLFPDTYEFYADSGITDIFEKMINNLETKLTQYKSEIENSGYTFHEMLTLASIVEQEAGSSDDRKGVAGVFYNRLEHNWSLGSDVTTYYAEKLELWSRDLYSKELKDCNDYNTRASCMAGKLPVGPICSPSLNSVISAIEPTESDYYYFVADIYGNTYFNKTATEHSKTVSKLKSEGKWYEY